jgi:hypothetical protein
MDKHGTENIRSSRNLHEAINALHGEYIFFVFKKGGGVVIKENGQYVSDAEAATAFNNHFINKVGRLREGMVSGDDPLAATRRRAEKLGLKTSSFGI